MILFKRSTTAASFIQVTLSLRGKPSPMQGVSGDDSVQETFSILRARRLTKVSSVCLHLAVRPCQARKSSNSTDCNTPARAISGLRARQLVASLRVRSRHVDVDRLERGTSRVFHLVLVTSFDHEDRPSAQRNPLPIYDRNALPGYDIEPLVSTAMTVSRSTFRGAGPDHHFRRLCLPCAQGDTKSPIESKPFRLHVLCSC